MAMVTRSVLLGLVIGVGMAWSESVTLFNGKDLQGWTGNPDFWKVQEGVLVGQTPGINYNTFLYTDEVFDNFVLKFKVKLTNHNSGVQFRSAVVDPKKFVMAGYQADIAPGYWGLLYEERKRGMIDFKMDTKKIADVDQWIDMEVRAEGPNITLTTNGTKTVQYVENDSKAGATSGKIGLQLHGGPAMKVEFKDIVLERLP
jgi:hypothetical protein